MEQRAVRRMIEPALGPRFGERLTWETGAENVMRGDVFERHLPNVAVRFYSEVFAVDLAEVFVDLRCEDAFVSQLFQREVESAKTGEQIDESQLILVGQVPGPS